MLVPVHGSSPVLGPIMEEDYDLDPFKHSYLDEDAGAGVGTGVGAGGKATTRN